MSSNLPTQVLNQGYEDTESIEDDIDILYSRFISPIDKIRSIAEAPQGNLSSNYKKNGITDLKTDPNNYMESRVHAFYRLLGLPVVSGNSFYNPGFNPIPKNSTKQDNINSSIDQKTLNSFLLKEQDAKNYSQMFSLQGFDTTLFGLVTLYTKPFNLLDSDIKPKIIDERKDIINKLKEVLPDLITSIDDANTAYSVRMGFGIESARHILKPFSVNPSIDISVMPVDNKICVPFLPDIESTKVSTDPDIYLSRPGIEFILRSRLKDTKPDPFFISNIQKVITQEKSPNPQFASDINTSAITDTIKALANSNDISNIDVNSIFGNFTTTQTYVVQQLIKTLKVIINKLHESIVDLYKVQEDIIFLPISSKQGYEKGNGSLRKTQCKTKLEKDIVALTIKKMNSERDIDIDRSLGNYATSDFINLEKTNTYSQQLEELTQKQNNLSSTGLNCLKNIEIITGEASGCGLIDIITIYTALWSIDIDQLLGLLDDDAFERLYNNVELRSPEVELRKSGISKPISICLESLETKINNILSFADLLYTNTFSSINNTGGGTL